ncbi:MAG: hypothetical protein GY867_12105 [bacterium]|nr:hypothetical protein [bacterium]
MSSVLELNPAQLLEKYLQPHLIDRYFESLMAQNRKVNLVSRETSREDFERLIAESLLPMEILTSGFGSYLDIGSGGGFPAIPIMATERVFGEAFLLERTQKKAQALQQILNDLDLPAIVHDKDFEHFVLPSHFDLITLRYVKLTPRLLSRIMEFLNPGGSFLYFSEPEFKVKEFAIDSYTFKSPQSDAIKSFSIMSSGC